MARSDFDWKTQIKNQTVYKFHKFERTNLYWQTNLQNQTPVALKYKIQTKIERDGSKFELSSDSNEERKLLKIKPKPSICISTMGDGGDLQFGDGDLQIDDGLEVLAIECWEIKSERDPRDWERKRGLRNK